MIYYVKNGGFDKLRLNDGRFYGEYRLAGENDRSFGNGVYIAREFKGFQIL